MTQEPLYRIEELSTNGWHLVDDNCSGLTKEQAKEKLVILIEHEGLNPQRLRFQREL